jgi:hypothetical protein
MALNYFASAPAMVLPPNKEHQSYPFGNPHLDHHDPALLSCESPLAPPHTQDAENTTMTDMSTSNPLSTTSDLVQSQTASRKSVRPHFPRPPSINYLAKTEQAAVSGRKRSFADTRDDEQDVADADGSQVSPQAPAPASKTRGEPVYGPGMTLIYPDDPSFAIAAESQTGTWAEEKAELETVIAQAVARRPVATSRKSQRRDTGMSLTIDPPVILEANGNSAMMNGSPSPTSIDVPIDTLALTLGIGWKRIPSSQAEAKPGWEKYIYKYYDHLTDPSILLHNEGLQAYLVRGLSSASDTQECWWVFQEDLSVCRLVGYCEADAIRSLQQNTNMGPPVTAASEPRRPSFGDLQVPPALQFALQDASTTAWTSSDTATNSTLDHDVEMGM